MAQSSQFATALIDETVQTFNGDVTALSPTDGANLIDSWISALHSGDDSTNPVAHTLSELKMELQNGNPNTSRIQSIIQELSEQTHQAALQAEDDQQRSLVELASALRGFGQQLSGGSSQGDMSRQGDMDDPTGSNGGLISDSGGAAATGTSGTDSSDFSGAPNTGSGSVAGDSYGASGASQQDSGSYGSGYGQK